MIDLNNGLYHCEKCQQDFPRFNWRLILSINLIDATGNVWVTCFQDEGEKILGSNAQQLGHLQATDKTGFTELVQVENILLSISDVSVYNLSVSRKVSLL